ncbi:MAG TPA: protein kinase [Acidimicrobiales bacterium]|jgi:serine/threonine-protein kinase|nr:protein kinase [Acidimicrobiales bacterium]
MRTTDSPTGTLLGGRYLLTRPLGAGSSATVYLAEDRSLRREVAVKVLRTGLSTDAAFLKRFRAEAVAVAGLNHPHVLRVFDWGEADGDAWLVTEYLAGGSLRDVLDHQGSLPIEQAVWIGAQAADGLAYAHARGFVHRDVKPSNLLFDDAGRIRITDFGVARALAEAAWTEPEGLIGTVRYTSPEQARGLGVDGKADVYSLALVLYECLTGVVPFAADSQVATLTARVDAALPEHPALGSLSEVLVAAAAPDPAARLDAASLAARLAELARTLPDPGGAPGLRHAASIGFHPPTTEELTGQHRVVRTSRGTSTHPATMAASVAPMVAPSRRAPDPDATTLGALAADATMVGSPNAPDATMVGSPNAPNAPDATMVGSPNTPDATMVGSPNAPDATRSSDPPPSAPSTVSTRRRRWPTVAVVFVVIAVAAAGGVYASRGTPTPTFRMPRLVGDTVAQARALLAADHVTIAVTSYQPSKSVPFDQIVRQHPTNGAKVPVGSAIHVVPSAGPPPERLPPVLGRSGPGAVAALATAGFSATIPISFESYSSTVPAGRVLAVYAGNAKDPTTAAFGSGLTLQLSKGPPPVPIPNEVGHPGQSAVMALGSLGFVPEVSHAFSRSVHAGNVISTTPGAHVRLQPDQVVMVVVSKGAPATVPSLGDLSLLKAERWIANAGLLVIAVHGSTKSHHWSTEPPAGTVVPQGSGVALYGH